MILCILAMVNTLLIRRRESAPTQKRAPAPLLDGVRRADWTGGAKAARRLGAMLAVRGEVAYCVGSLDERRGEAGETLGGRTAARIAAALRRVCESDGWVRAQTGLKVTLARALRMAVRPDGAALGRAAAAAFRIDRTAAAGHP